MEHKLFIVLGVILLTFSAVSADSITSNVSITNAAPVIGDITITPDPFDSTSDVTLTCEATVTDNNGYLNINTSNGTFWHSSSGESASDHDTDHYSNTSCSVSDNTSTTSATGQCTFFLTSDTIVGEWTCKVIIADETNITDSSSSTVSTATVQDTTDSGGGGGGTGGAYSTERTNYFAEIQPDTKIRVTDIPGLLSKVEFVTTKLVKDVKIQVRSASKPSSISSPDGVIYKFVEVSHANLEDNDISEATISFKVEKSWINGNGLDPTSITLQRYKNGWNKLKTKKVTEDDDFYYGSAKSPGLSLFSITADKLEKTDELVGEIEDIIDSESDEDSEKKITSTFLTGAVIGSLPQSAMFALLSGAGILLLVIFILLLSSYIKKRRLKKPSVSKHSVNTLRRFVQNNIQKGYKTNVIKKHLLNHGWKKKHVDKAIKNATKRGKR